MRARNAVVIGVVLIALPAGFLVGRRAGNARHEDKLSELRALCAEAQKEAWSLRRDVTRVRCEERREARAKSAPKTVAPSKTSVPEPPTPKYDFATFQEAMRRMDWDAALRGVSRDAIEAVLAKNGRTEELLVAAASTLGDDEAALDYALEALQKDPDGPTALLAGIHRLIKLGEADEALVWIDKLKEADPANSLPDYYAAWIKMKKGDLPGGLEDLKGAEAKTFISDYVSRSISGLEAFYREEGCSESMAKINACAGLRLGHLLPLRDLAEATAEQATEAFDRGEQGSALSLADHARKLGDRLAAGSRLLVESFVGFAIETRALELERQIYLARGEQAKLEEVERKIANNRSTVERMKRIGKAGESALVDLSESEAVAYFEGLIRDGEAITARDLPAVREALEDPATSTEK